MEVLLDIALAVLGTLGKRYKPGEALGRLDASQEVGIVTVLCPGANYVGIMSGLLIFICTFIHRTQHNFRDYSYIATVSLMRPRIICLIKSI